MFNEDLNQKLEVTREEMVELLNEDLGREYQAIISYIVHSQAIKGASFTHIAKELEKHSREELDHALKLSRQIDYLGGMPSVAPKTAKTSPDAEEMLRIDFESEHETISYYTQRIRQADAMGEFALAGVLREIIVVEQEHETDLATALGIEVPHHEEEVAGRF
jgi:bacterioferritin